MVEKWKDIVGYEGREKVSYKKHKNWCSNDNFVSLWKIYWNLNCCDRELPMIEVIGNIYDNKELLKND